MFSWGVVLHTHRSPPMPGVGMSDPASWKEMVTNPKDVLSKVGGGRGQDLGTAALLLMYTEGLYPLHTWVHSQLKTETLLVW